MDEAGKTNRIRSEEFLQTVLAGRVIDIGCGTNPVVPYAEGFDVADGDANVIDTLRPAESYDCVHSSHCLEHMHDPPDALRRWWRLVKPGGYLVVVVPHEDLYEQGVWPSRFNRDHKATFRLNVDRTSWSPCSHDIGALVADLPQAKVVSAEVQDQNYDHGMMRLGPESLMSQFLRGRMMALYRRLMERKLLSMPLLAELNRFFFDLGTVVDQTTGPALAQIQVVARKTSE